MQSIAHLFHLIIEHETAYKVAIDGNLPSKFGLFFVFRSHDATCPAIVLF